MSISADIKVVGIKDALRELNNIDKSARRDLTKRYKEVVQPVIDEITRNFPKGTPISGFARGWDPAMKRGMNQRLSKRDAWESTVQEEKRRAGALAILPWDYNGKAVKAGVSGKRPRRGAGRHSSYMSNLATFYIRWTGPGARLFDISGRGSAGKGSGATMIRGLESKFGKASRLMWPSFERKRESVEDAIRDIVNDLMKRVNRDVRV